MRPMNFDSPLYTPSRIRAQGWAAAASGALLALITGGLSAGFAWVLLMPEGRHGVKFDGDSAMAAAIMAIFVFLFLFGAAATWAGFHQIHAGLRGLQFGRFGVIVLSAFAILGGLARTFNG